MVYNGPGRMSKLFVGLCGWSGVVGKSEPDEDEGEGVT